MNKKRILAISDIHGCLNKLVLLLEKVNYNSEEDQLVLLGDMCDRGHQNIKTIKYAMELQKNGAIVLRGNHEELAYDSLCEIINDKIGVNVGIHRECGGINTITEFMNIDQNTRIEIKKFLNELKNYVVIDKYVFVHSGVNPTYNVEENFQQDLLWSRDEFIYSNAYEDKTVIFGHTPTPYMTGNKNESFIWFDNKYNDKIGIDCGCVFYGRLGCLEINLDNNEYKTHYVGGEND